MVQFFRHGIMEYDKRPPKLERRCEACGVLIQKRGGKRFCMPCKDRRLEAQIAARRLRSSPRTGGER